MPKFFKYKNNEYSHAYHRDGKTVWVKGQIDGQKFHRMSTKKKLSVANMNYVEKNWKSLIQTYWDEKLGKEERAKQLTIAELVEPALETNETASKGTKKKYRGIFNKHILPAFGEMIPDDITAGVFKKFQVDLREKKKLGKKTIDNIRSAFSCIIQYMNEAEISDKNPLSLVKPPASKLFISYNEDGEAVNQKGVLITESIDPFTYEDVQILVGAAEGQFKNILTVQFLTGMRIGEMCTLRWDDVDFNNRTIHVQRSNKDGGEIGSTKNGKTRKVTMKAPVAAALQEQFKSTGLQRGFIFLAKHGGRYRSYDTFSDNWRNLLIRTGYDYRRFYQTRHTFACIMLQKNEKLSWVSKIMLGHSEQSTTLRFYADYIPDSNEENATFLDDFCTNSVQNENLKVESA